MKNNEIKGISLENFRVFKDKCDFELAPITILTGANSSGKSSVIKALKLMQGFWKKLYQKGILDFSEGSHELGDFENILTYNSVKKEITITYNLANNILFGNLKIGNVFELDDSNDLNNGLLIRTTLFENETNSILFENTKTKIETSNKSEGYEYKVFINYEFIIDRFAPKLLDLAKKQELFLENCPRMIECEDKSAQEGIEAIIEFGNYQGWAKCKKVSTTVYDEEVEDYVTQEELFWIPIINEQLCKYLQIDFEIVKDMIDYEGIPFLPGYPTLIERKFLLYIREYLKNNAYVFDNLYNSKVLNLIFQIPIKEYTNFEEVLWNKLREFYSKEIEDMGKEDFFTLSSIIDEQVKQSISNYTSSFSLFEEANAISNWREFIKSNFTEDLIVFFKTNEKEEISNISNYINNPQDSIINFNSQNRKIPTLDSVIFHSILFYSTLLDSKIFKQDNPDIFNWDISSKMPLVEMIIKEMESLTYQLVKYISINTYFVDAIRANVQRFYTFASQGTSFNAVLSKFQRQTRSIEENKFLNKWMNKFQIGSEIDIKRISKAGVEIYLIRGGKRENLIDVGYGVTPFLSLILNIIVAVNDYATRQKEIDSQELYESVGKIPLTITVEEAEINLHPKLQSLIADFLIDAQKTFNVNFIIESHSEYLIRKLQYLTAKSEIAPENTVIHYIEDGGKIRTIHIESSGQLSQPFGSGFIDEADNLAMELWSFA